MSAGLRMPLAIPVSFLSDMGTDMANMGQKQGLLSILVAVLVQRGTPMATDALPPKNPNKKA